MKNLDWSSYVHVRKMLIPHIYSFEHTVQSSTVSLAAIIENVSLSKTTYKGAQPLMNKLDQYLWLFKHQ